MSGRSLSALTCAVAAVVLCVAAVTGVEATHALPASVVPFDAEVATVDVRVLDGAGLPLGTEVWRAVSGTGNCCENYLTMSDTGRLLDFGGGSARYSDDRGLSWSDVLPRVPVGAGGEGAIVQVPGGDVVGVGWSFAEADRVEAVKYDASAGSWFTAEVPLHTPFFDRPWLAVIPGPFTVGTVTAPYVTVLMGGVGAPPVWYVSLDGLEYALATSPWVDALTRPPVGGWLDVGPDPATDGIQPHASTGIAPLPGRDALLGEAPGCERALFAPDLRWSCFTPPDGSFGEGSILVDSAGRMHRLSFAGGFVLYATSSDGGRSWRSTAAVLPGDLSMEDFDFKTSAAAALSAVTVHAHDVATGVDQDLVLRFAIAPDGAPALDRIYLVGAGDQDFGSGVGSALRFDFSTIAIFGDGRVAVSFADAAHLNPAIAIQP